MTSLVLRTHSDTAEFKAVEAVAQTLLSHLQTPAAERAIREADRPGASSALVQATFQAFAEGLGFVNESTNLFKNYRKQLRPDYFLPVGNTGILLEVERGKTTINNMDMLDFWKCHLCEHANYLFLMVPMRLQQHDGMRPRNEYAYVVERLRPFFEDRNATNVRAVFVFGC